MTGIIQKALFWSGVCFYSIFGLDFGYYSSSTNGYARAYLLHLENKADLCITVNRDYLFSVDLELGNPPNTSSPHVALNLEGLKSFLEARKKDLLVIKLHPLVMADGRKDEFVDYLKGPLLQIGYKRVVFLGASSMGIHYLSDIKSTD
jgi:hypothetical protein